MLIDLFKILLAEPGKLKRAGLILCKLILSLIVTHWLYSWIVGPYSIIDILDFRLWVDCVISGRLLLALVFFGLSDFVLWNVLSPFTAMPLTFVSGKLSIDKINGDPLTPIFHRFRLIEKVKSTGKIRAGKNTKEFFDFVSLMTLKETKDALTTLKNSFVSSLWHTYIVFVLVYFIYIDIPILHKSLFQFVIWGSIILIAYLFICADIILDIILKHGESLKFALHGLLLKKHALEVISQISGIELISEPKDHQLETERIKYDNIEHIVKLNYSLWSINYNTLKAYHEVFALGDARRLLILTNMEIDEAASDYLAAMDNQIHVIVFKEENDLEVSIRTFFNQD